MTRLAAIDCGTNSLRLLVAETDPGQPGEVVEILRRVETVRLGEGLESSRRISDAALSRAVAVARDYAGVCAGLGVEAIDFVATSAARDAVNMDEFFTAMRGCFPDGAVRPRLLSGHDEAALSFRGATAAVARGREKESFLVVDLGGGSTEFAFGGSDLVAAASVDVGAVRLTERCLGRDPLSAESHLAVRTAMAEALDRIEDEIRLADADILIGVAGSVTTITAHALKLSSHDLSQAHLVELPASQVVQACTDLASLPGEVRAALPYLHPGRVDVIVAGALMWAVIVERFQRVSGSDRVVTSVHDILDGLIAEMAGRA